MHSLRILAGAMVLVLVVWWAGYYAAGQRSFILPDPWATALAMHRYAGLIAHHAAGTALAVGIGILLGVVIGAYTAISLALSPFARTYLRPLLVGSQAIPVFALAPILMIWFGFGIESKIVMALLIIYFPVTSNFYDGLVQTPRGYLDLARSMGAPGWRQLLHIRIPAALPSLGSGLRLAAVYAPIGAVIGEWVGGEAWGLGYLMTYANSRTKIDLMFAALIVLAVMTILLHWTVDRACRRLEARYT